MPNGVDCGAGPQPGASLALTNVAADATCTIANARKPAPAPPTPAFGAVTLDRAGEGELELVPGKKAADRLGRRGRLTANPRIRFFAAGTLPGIALRHEFGLRKK